MYNKKTKYYKLVGFCDVGYARDKNRKKKHEWKLLISWASKRQQTIVLSATKV